jgi:hypothetical protein
VAFVEHLLAIFDPIARERLGASIVPAGIDATSSVISAPESGEDRLGRTCRF